MTTSATATIVTCSVCLGTYNLHPNDETPIRHGFTAHNVRHGQTGGWQTGACGGLRFPHLGISDEGTVWAIDQIGCQISAAQTDLQALAGNPPLPWNETEYGGYGRPKKVVATHTINVGDDADYRIGKPAYAALHARHTEELTHRIARLTAARIELQAVVDGWTKAKYAPVTVAKRGVVLHKATNWGKARAGQVYTVAACQRWAFHPTNARLAATDAEVTCVRCRKA